MLYRAAGSGRICITQPAHAWVSGQLAHAWGNDFWGCFAPHKAVCLGAEQHDIGWLPWETTPVYNPETGYPQSFMEVPPQVHTQLWAEAKKLTLPMGRYVALLVSGHGIGLYQRFTGWKSSPEATQVVERFLQQEQEFQRQLIANLEQDPVYAPYATPAAIARNQQLVATWDSFSLLVCMGLTQPQSINQVPTADGHTTLTLTPINSEGSRVQVKPWCFEQQEVTLVVEGRQLEQSANEQAMREQLATAPWVTLTISLTPDQAP